MTLYQCCGLEKQTSLLSTFQKFPCWMLQINFGFGWFSFSFLTCLQHDLLTLTSKEKVGLLRSPVVKAGGSCMKLQSSCSGCKLDTWLMTLDCARLPLCLPQLPVTTHFQKKEKGGLALQISRPCSLPHSHLCSTELWNELIESVSDLV